MSHGLQVIIHCHFHGKSTWSWTPPKEIRSVRTDLLDPTAQFPASMGSRGSRHLATWPWLHPEHVKLDIHDDIMWYKSPEIKWLTLRGLVSERPIPQVAQNHGCDLLRNTVQVMSCQNSIESIHSRNLQVRLCTEMKVCTNIVWWFRQGPSKLQQRSKVRIYNWHKIVLFFPRAPAKGSS